MSHNSATSLRDRLRALHMPESAAPSFDPDAAPDEPHALLHEWITTAIDGGVVAPHAMTLATSSPEHGPSARTLLLRDVVGPDAHGASSSGEAGWLEFVSLDDSAKGRDLATDRRAALVLHWREQHRQIRVTGEVITASAEEAAEDFLARPPKARAATVAGRQSDLRPDDDEVARLMASAAELLAVNPLFVPPSWTVYRLVPQSVEFWQGQPGSEQLRLRYRREVDGWRRERLWP